MRKHLFALTMATTLLASSFATFALTPEEIKVRDEKHTVVKQNAVNYTENFYKQSKQQNPYSYSILFNDKYGNIIQAKTKYNGSGISIGTRRDKEFTVKDTATRTGYKPSNINVKASKEDKVTTVVLEEDKINNTVMGKVEFPQGVDTNGWYIEVVKASDRFKMYPIPEMYIKVNQDGTFKALNVPDGDYVFTLVNGKTIYSYQFKESRNSSQKFDDVKRADSFDVTIKGNLNKTFKLTKPNNTISVNDLFTYADKGSTEITSDLVMSDKLKKAVDEKLPKTKDVNTLSKIVPFMLEQFPNPKSNGFSKTRMLKTLNELELNSNNFLDGCEEFALVFNAIARNLGFETNYVYALNTDWMSRRNSSSVEGHVFIEVKVDDKWILVDSTRGDIYTDYDRDDKNVLKGISDTNTNELGLFYIVHTSNNAITSYSTFTDEIDMYLNTMTVFDSTLVDKDTKNTPQIMG